MRKIAVARCAFVVLTLSIVAASGADKTVTRKDLGFEITIPESWTSKSDARSLSLACGDGASKASITLGHCKMNDGETPKSMMETKLGFLAKDSTNYEFVEQGEFKVAGLDAYKATFNWDQSVNTSAGKAQIRLRGELCFVLAGVGRMYVIATSVSKEDKDKYKSDIDAIVKSFKLTETK